MLVDGPDGSLDVLHAHEALVQAQVVADGVLWAERAGELSGTALAPLPGPLLFLPILLLAQPLQVPKAALDTLGLATAKRSAKPPGDAANACSPHRHHQRGFRSHTWDATPFHGPWPDAEEDGDSVGQGTSHARSRAALSAAARSAMLGKAS